MGQEAALKPDKIRAQSQDHHDTGDNHDTTTTTTKTQGRVSSKKKNTSPHDDNLDELGEPGPAGQELRQQQKDKRDGDYLQLGDFVGEHGAYQMALTLLLFVRYVFLGLMANSGPLMTPDVTFYCKLPESEIMMIMPNITLMSEQERELELKEEFKQICQIDLHLYQNQSSLLGNSSSVGRGSSSSFRTIPISSPSGLMGGQPMGGNLTATTTTGVNWANTTANQASDYFASRIRECTDFTYQLAQDQGRTMTSEFDLVCDRDWLRSLFQSLLSAAIVVAHVFWGTFSDKYGRFQAQRICLVVSLVAGLFSIFAWDFWTFTLARALCSFGDLGLVVSMTTTLVELVGSKYRGCSVALVNFGYALGVTLLPYIVAYFEDFRLVIGFTVLCHMVTMPLVLATNESVRWLLTNRRFKSAKRELKRVARLNQRFRSPGKTDRDDGGDDDDQMNDICSLTGGKVRKLSLREKQKRKFELKFDEFIKQIESQNLCDPIVPEPASNDCCPPSPQTNTSHANSHVRSTSMDGGGVGARRIQPGGPLASTATRPQSVHSTSSSNLPSGLSHLLTRGRGLFATPPKIVTTPAPEIFPFQLTTTKTDVHQPPRPRILAQIDLDQLERIREVESTSSVAGGHGGNATTHRKRSQSGGLLNDALIRSLEMRHQQRLLDDKMKTLTLPHAHAGGGIAAASGNSISRASSISCELDAAKVVLRRPTASNYQDQPYQCARPPDCINLVAHQLSFVGRVSRLFKDKKLMIAVFTIVWTTFNSELLYTSFIIINLEVGEDLYLNYVLGGCMEALAAIAASLLLSYSPRRISLIAFWLLISFACFGLSLAHIDSTWAVWMLALAKFSQSCLSSIATVAAYESFPTFLRQSGSGLVFTLGMLGSVFAPLIFAEFDDHAGMDRVLMTFSVSSLTAATLIYLCLNETRDCELM